MYKHRLLTRSAPATTAVGLVLGLVSLPVSATDPTDSQQIEFISQSEILAGLAPETVYPFVDSTPNRIRRAHIAVTDSTENCGGPGSGAPDHVQILVGEAGGTLVPVLSEATNTGISINPDQCVFHVTVRAGANGVPGKVTDIVVVNGSDSALTGVNTITVSAVVVLR